MNRVLILLILLGFVACKNQSDESKTTSASQAAIPPNDSKLAQKLYEFYIPNPTDQAHIDQNLIIDHALSNNMNLTRTSSGLYYIIKKDGAGPNLTSKESLSVDYKGAFLDGKVFDSSYERGQPIVFKIGQMVAGWNEGLTYLKHGSTATFLIPSRLGYGAKGYTGFVPPNKVLVFDIEVH